VRVPKEAAVEVLSSRVLLRPSDFERSRRFYEETLGLHIYREFASRTGRGIVFFLGSGFLELSGLAPPAERGRVSLWLQVPDLAETHRALAAEGVEILEGPARKPWGLDEMWIADPDGVRIVLVEVPPDHPLRWRPNPE
jgi:catechol 2,3-dioxygenase-like lactoylglutathione lyase family enzyme